MTVDLNKAKGVLFGQAIGDALGIPIEFRSKKHIEGRFGEGGFPTEYEAARDFAPGDYSDDTEQALCILQSYIDHRDIVPTDIAQKFLAWYEQDGRGAGGHTRKVFAHPDFRQGHPLAASEDIWRESGGHAAANGAVMRTAYVGLLRSHDIAWTVKAAKQAAQVTHFDPRCVASAVGVSVAIARMVQGYPTRDAIKEAAKQAGSIHGEAVEWMTRKSLDDLWLDEGLEIPRAQRTKRPPIGYTFKTLGAGFWAIRIGLIPISDDGGVTVIQPTFLSALGAILNAGGDSDTNGAVAGALLGAHFGFDAIPKDLVDGLQNREVLELLWKDMTQFDGAEDIFEKRSS